MNYIKIYKNNYQTKRLTDIKLFQFNQNSQFWVLGMHDSHLILLELDR